MSEKNDWFGNVVWGTAALLSGVLAVKTGQYVSGQQAMQESAKPRTAVVYEMPQSIVPHTRRYHIVIDAGHGMGNTRDDLFDSGAVSNGYREADVTLMQARRIAEQLRVRGYKVTLTRNDNTTNTPLNDRNDGNADLFMSLHTNAATAAEANGFETYHNPEGESAAQYISDSMDGLGMRNRGICNGNFRVLRPKAKAPSVLVETGFLTNNDDRARLIDVIPDIETAIWSGVDRYFIRDVMENRRR